MICTARRFRMTLVLLFLFASASCVRIDGERIEEVLQNGAREQRLQIAATAVEFRQQNGRWPENVAAMEPFMKGDRRSLFEAMLKERVEMRTNAQGLQFVAVASGETGFTVSNDSTESRPVILEGKF